MIASIASKAIVQHQQNLTICRPITGITLQGQIKVPGDKSISHRALIFGALAQGETKIQGLSIGEDVASTAKCLRSLGADISNLTAPEILVRGQGLEQFLESSDILNAGNSGTTMRLMLGILAARENRFFTLTGDRLSVMATQLSYMGAKITEHPDGLEIEGGSALSGAEVASHDDHRIAMSLAVAALRASGKTVIKEATAANISYPNFFDSLQQVCC